MKTFIFYILLFLPLLAGAQIGAKTQQGKLYGIWQNTQFGYQMTLMLNADGTGEFDGEVIRFTNQGTKLSLMQNGQTTNYSYTLQENSLTLSGGDLDQSITFTRNGAQVQSPVTLAETEVKTPHTSSGDADLIGIWSGNGESIEFKTDGRCVYMGNTFSYQRSQGHITLATSQGNVMFAYSITGNQLNLTANGKQFTYERGASTASSVAGNSKGGQVAQELVGKWCWTNVNSTNTGGSSSSECIALNANGTYEYASERSMDANTSTFYAGTASQAADQGTWWVEGDKIFYNSQTRGQGSYQLQRQNHPKTGDPMILLNGEPYVTFYQKQPWR
jgi:hypothetical protein